MLDRRQHINTKLELDMCITELESLIDSELENNDWNLDAKKEFLLMIENMVSSKLYDLSKTE